MRCGFEFGLRGILVPLMALVVGFRYFQALISGSWYAGVFLFLYVSCFSLLFDRLFGLRLSRSRAMAKDRMLTHRKAVVVAAWGRLTCPGALVGLLF